jgi:hypothetical protein
MTQVPIKQLWAFFIRLQAPFEKRQGSDRRARSNVHLVLKCRNFTASFFIAIAADVPGVPIIPARAPGMASAREVGIFK